MQANFNVTPEELVETSKTLSVISTDFLNEVKTMYNSLDDLITKWQGKGADQYYKSILNRRPDVEALGNVIGQYSSFLSKAATIYNRTDADIASSASKF